MSEYDNVLPTRSRAEDSPIVAQGIEQARLYAALSGPFDPVQAVRSVEQVEAAGPSELTAIAAGLSQACDTILSAVTGQWLMRGVERQRILNGLPADQVRSEVARRWDTAADDQPTRDLLSAIQAVGIFAADAVATAVARATRPAPDREDGRGAVREVLERIAIGLGRAGPLAPQYQEVPRVKAALTHLDLVESATANRDRGFFGRDAELAQIIRWLDQVVTQRPLKALYIDGLPGIGKSALLEEVAARLLGQDDDWVVVRLDFDRAGLDVLDLLGLTLEVARQVSAQVPGAEQAIQHARDRAARELSLKGGRKGSPEDLAAVLANALSSPPRRMLLLLDTLEVLRARGETHRDRLFFWLDDLAGSLGVPLVVVGAGRGEALNSIFDRVEERIPLTGLDDVSANQLLHRLEVEPGSWSAVRAAADGNPLALRLAAKFTNEHGPRALAKARGRGELAVPVLYRAILSRLDNDALKKLAIPGLVVRRINADVIREVIGPQVGLKDLTRGQADELFQALAGQHWLVQPDAVAIGFVRHRADVRQMLLSPMYDAEPAKSARIDRAAARWFGVRSEGWAAVESAYHQLQLMRRRTAVPPIDPAVLAQLDLPTIEELPEVAQDVVLQSRGERSTSFRGEVAQAGRPLGGNAVAELRAMNERSDWLEGNYIYDRAYAGAAFDPTSPDANPAVTFLWRSGRWREARGLLERQGGWDRAGAPGREGRSPFVPEDNTSFLDTICRLELGAELSFDACVEALVEDPAVGRSAMSLAMESTASGLASAALRFAFQRAGIEFQRTIKQYDVAANATTWWEQGIRTTVFSGENPGWERITGRTGPLEVSGADPSVVTARAFAVLTPFTDLVATMSQLPGHEYFSRWATSVGRALDELGYLAPQGSEPWHNRGSVQPPQALADMGLLAETIGAAAYLHEDPDLRLVAQAAERWRRTTAGSWSYRSTKPTAWARPVDVSIADRVEGLRDGSDSYARAEAQLEAWCPELRADDVLELLRRRAPKIYSDAGQVARKDVMGAAALLLRRNVPSAFVPPFAVLLRRRHFQM
ncbi:ATP-binding protein [Kribbella sp. NPDC026611]|uniref:ATP-binding protein n=1 Tax=Kribbella sp. NPDC026611 TaxID=3154911 RepID=UPI0033D15FC8